jgi:hypothetical protein
MLSTPLISCSIASRHGLGDDLGRRAGKLAFTTTVGKRTSRIFRHRSARKEIKPTSVTMIEMTLAKISGRRRSEKTACWPLLRISD